MSYSQLAAKLGRKGASRAVGAANGANPIPIVVPCHRVIGADGSLTGFGSGLPRKQWLLDHERRAMVPSSAIWFAKIRVAGYELRGWFTSQEYEHEKNQE